MAASQKTFSMESWHLEGEPKAAHKDVCKRDMKALDISTESWEDLAADHMMWRSTQNQHLKSGERTW